MIIRLYAILSFVFAIGCNSATAQAIHYVVNHNDTGPGSLRGEIQNAQPGDIVVIALNGVYVPQSPIAITKPISIHGPKPIHYEIDASQAQTAFEVNFPSTGGAKAYLDGLKITSSAASGISVLSGRVDINRSVFQNCDGVSGGAIVADDELLLRSCSFLGNSASGHGGAIQASANTSITNCTFHDNYASSNGGAIRINGGNSTFIHNTFYSNDCSGLGGAIHIENGYADLQNNLIYDNGNSSTGVDLNVSVGTGGSFNSSGGNFIGSDVATMVGIFSPHITDVYGSTLNPNLRASILIDGYGLGYFPIVSATSPAVDIGNSLFWITRDQRRCYRVMTGGSSYLADAGAIEYTPYVVTSTSGAGVGGGAVQGSLGWALDGVNSSTAATGLFAVVFELPSGNTGIQAAGNYIVVNETIIDGFTQPGSEVPGPIDGSTGNTMVPGAITVEINGSSASASGLVLQAHENTEIRGLSIHSFPSDGIVLSGVTSAKIEGVNVGVEQDGISAGQGNLRGIVLKESSKGNYIGDWEFSSRNVVVSNDSSGIVLKDSGTTQNNIYHSYVGINALGTGPLGNGAGIRIIDSAANNQIGDSALFRNIISGNIGAGVLIADTISDINRVYGNYIGTDFLGTSAVGNGKGVVLGEQSNLNAIGQAGSDRFNLISGNTGVGIEVMSWWQYIQGNAIGTDITGLSALPNGSHGIYCHGAQGFQVIGGESAGNIIAGNGGDGIRLEGSSWSGIAGNLIGVGLDSVTAIPNQGSGIRLDTGAVFIGIGGDSLTKYNMIGHNMQHGIELFNTNGGHTIAGNFIGISSDGINIFDIGNTLDGIHINESSFWGTRIGDSLVNGPINAIAFNGGNGISIIGDSGNRIYRTATAANGGLGIDLNNDGVTSNDNGDGDFGPNGLLNFPVLQSAVSCGNGTAVSGTLNTSANKPVRIEFYWNDQLDPSNHGEGIEYIGALIDTTDATGNLSFTYQSLVSVPVGEYITATTTTLNGVLNSSEYSEGVQVTGGLGPPQVSPDVSFCYGAVTDSIYATPQSGGEIVWYYDEALNFVKDTSEGIYPNDTVSWTYYVVESVGGACLSTKDSVQVTIIPLANPYFEYNQFCVNNPGGPDSVATAGGTWSIVSGGSGNESIDPSTGVIINADEGVTYSVMYVTNGSQCPDTSTMSVQALPSPVITNLAVSNEMCEGDYTGEISFQVTGGTSPYVASIDGGQSFQTNTTFTGLTNGTYAIVVEDQAGCEAYDIVTILSDYLNPLDLSAADGVCAGQAYQFNAFGQGQFTWSGPALSDSTIPNPAAMPDSSALYVVSLLAPNGCLFRDSIFLFVDYTDDCGAIVYNAFSPNGDGINDTWVIPAVQGSQDNEVFILNRWGDELEHIRDYDNVNQVWDGTDKSGAPLPSGTYYYVIYLHDIDRGISGFVEITK